jgi:hypothetical protein
MQAYWKCAIEIYKQTVCKVLFLRIDFPLNVMQLQS